MAKPSHSDASLPVVDIAALLDGSEPAHAAGEIGRACRQLGFFRVAGHGIAPETFERLCAAAHEFFARPEADKAQYAMARAGAAWRGWFPNRGELTSGRPDRKEGLYIGVEHAPDHPRVIAGTPLHGANLLPPGELAEAVAGWLATMRPLADALMGALAIGLGLPGGWFEKNLTADPTELFRIFHYPAMPDNAESAEWGVGEHTDYGLLTILAQDALGGLQVRSPGGSWIDVPGDPSVLVCNIGDMLDRLTAGRYVSTPHRVRNASGTGRLSFPYFFDPSWDAEVVPLPLPDDETSHTAARSARWDGADLQAWSGRYGDYLTAKVAKVFPDLFAKVS